MAKKIKNAFEAATSQLFDPRTIDASAFEHAARQIEAALDTGEKLSEMIRAQALELIEFADLVETTLEARAEEPGEDKDAPKEEPKKEKTEAAPKQENVAVAAEPKPAPEPAPEPALPPDDQSRHLGEE